MRHLNVALFIFTALLFIGVSDVQAFNFDFGDDDDYYHPYFRPAYNPWFGPPLGYGPPPGYFRPPAAYYPPRLPSYDSSTMVRKRQRIMSDHDEAMDRLYEILYGNYGFDRAEAVKLARKIEVTSGIAMTGNFHPGAVADFRSRTTPAYWGNEQTFRANAQALQAAAKDLAIELAKKPSAEEGAIMMPRRGASVEGENAQSAPVSPGVWEKFNALSHVCESCHSTFRGSSW